MPSWQVATLSGHRLWASCSNVRACDPAGFACDGVGCSDLVGPKCALPIEYCTTPALRIAVNGLRESRRGSWTGPGRQPTLRVKLNLVNTLLMDDRSATSERVASFGPFRLFPAQQLLLEGETPVRVGARALEILNVLVERAGELVSKKELMTRVWANIVVEESNLKVQVAAL